jgi:hypothetical protein
MKIYTELIVLHADIAMPDDERFCPSFWEAEDFDSDGDFYADALEGRWTRMKLTKRRAGGANSVMSVHALRENRPYEPATREVADLQRFIDRYRAGDFAHLERVAGLPAVAVTSLSIETPDLGDYREYLETVRNFIAAIRGMLIAPWEADETEFTAEFLD